MDGSTVPMVADTRGSVLVVDDDPVIRQLMRSSLQHQRCAVRCAASGAEALSLAVAEPPDLILLDVVLPDIDGIDVCRRVRAEPLLAEVPIIMITARNDPDARLRSLEVGADDFITKPVDFLELRARVGTILRLNRYRRLLEERLHRQRAEEEMARRNRELSLLNAFITSTAATIHTAFDIEDTLRSACRVLVEALDLCEAQAWLLPAGSARPLSVSVAAGAPNGAGRGPMTGYISLDMARLLVTVNPAEIWATGDPPPFPLPAAAAGWLRAQEDRSLLIVPIAINGRFAGAIVLMAPAGRVFAAQDRALGQSLASSLGQAIEAALLHQQLQRHVDSLEDTVATRTTELQAERDRTQAILEALGEAVIVTDADFVIRYINPATVLLTGYDSSELIGRSWPAMQRDEPTAMLYRSIRDHVATGRTWRGEVIGSRRDGSTYDAAMTVAPIFEPRPSGAPIGLVGILRDITPLKDAERMKDRFISNVSHELRTPLSIIALHGGNLDTLYERLGDEQRRRLIREVRAQADLLDELIGDVLELSRIDSGRLKVEHRSLDLAELLRCEVELLRPLAERKGLRLELRAEDALHVQGDDAQLRQCIRNLISNAIKFTAQGSVCCECRKMIPAMADMESWPNYTDVESGGWAGLRVADTGIGIDADHLPHLFERFYRVQNQTRVPGTGLGLAITRELVIRHGGWTGVASTLGAGSVFAFYLPLADE